MFALLVDVGEILTKDIVCFETESPKVQTSPLAQLKVYSAFQFVNLVFLSLGQMYKQIHIKISLIFVMI